MIKYPLHSPNIQENVIECPLGQGSTATFVQEPECFSADTVGAGLSNKD